MSTLDRGLPKRSKSLFTRCAIQIAGFSQVSVVVSGCGLAGTVDKLFLGKPAWWCILSRISFTIDSPLRRSARTCTRILDDLWKLRRISCGYDPEPGNTRLGGERSSKERLGSSDGPSWASEARLASVVLLSFSRADVMQCYVLMASSLFTWTARSEAQRELDLSLPVEKWAKT